MQSKRLFGKTNQKPHCHHQHLQQQQHRRQPAADQAAAAAAAATQSATCDYQLVEERGLHFIPGRAFYRAESAQGRDLAVLAAALHKRRTGGLRVLDVMAGSGMRGARYLQQAGADMVWCNDHDTRNEAALVHNLVSALKHSSSSGGGSSGSSSGEVLLQARQWLAAAERVQYPGIRGDVLQFSSSSSSDSGSSKAPESGSEQPHQKPRGHQEQQCCVTHVDANRLLASCYLAEDYYDLVDVDSFGSDSSHLAAAIGALRYGGLLYLTSTDGFSSGGKRPQRSLAAYGSYLRALPHANEQGLRMLIAAAVREGAARGVALRPLFSLYSYHGPVFRVMLRCERSNEGLQLAHYGFVGHCHHHGENRRVGWRGLSSAWCRCRPVDAASAAGTAGAAGVSSGVRPTPLVLSGPLWTGPLHDQEFLSSMIKLAQEWGWQGSAVPADSPYVVRQSKNNRQKPLEVLLALLQQEADPRLPPWYICIGTLAQHLTTTPSRDKLIAALQQQGYVACQCHVENRALRTDATTQQVLQVAVDVCGYLYRQQPRVPAVLLQRQEVLLEADDEEQQLVTLH